jgi:multidrug efflux pump subunit AcrB
VSETEPRPRGPLAWMASNAVAANLLMIFFLVGGLMFVGTLTQEVFPEIELDMVTVAVAYPGASPEEIEDGVLLSVEEEVRGIDGIKQVRSIAVEGQGVVTAELRTSADDDRVLNDVKSAVDRITSFPQDAERPIVSLLTNRTQVLYLVIHGEVPRKTLDALAEDLRSELLLDPRVTLVEVDGVPPPEISIEVPQENLRRYGLTLQQVANAVSAASIDLPGGSVKTSGGEVLVRTTERRDFGEEFEGIAVISRPDGSRVLLGDVARVIDGYRDTDDEAYYEGEPAVRLRVFRVGDETPTDVAAAVRELVAKRRETLPPSLGVAVLDDQSKIYDERISLLLKNGRLGAFLVLLVLGLFLQPRLAFWVALGIPISFLGAFLVMPWLDVSINMVSLFAFILVLGIVVDDAIVVGEAVFHHRMLGKSPLRAAIDGTREVLAPVVFAVTTTIFAFSPLLFVPGITGKFFEEIPLIVIPILVISLIESLVILPAHLAHVKSDQETRTWRALQWVFDRQKAFSDGMERWIDGPFQRFLRGTVARRYLTISVAAGMLVVTVGLVAGNHLKFYFFPRIEGDQIHAAIELPFGASVDQTRAAMERVVEAMREVIAHAESEREPDDGKPPLLEGIYSQIGVSQPPDMAGVFGGPGGGGHLALVQATLSPSDERSIPGSELTRRWRQATGEIPGVDRLAFSFNTGPSAGAPVALELSHRDIATLERAATALAERLGTYDGVFDIDDGFQVGKPQLDLKLLPAAKALGLDEAGLASQVRSAFFGAEAKRQQRGRDELRVYVRRPESERQSLFHIENLLVRTPAGGEVPLAQAATVDIGRSYTSIERIDGRRTVIVSADVDETATTPNRVIGSLERDVLPALMADFPGLTYGLAGEQEAQAEATSSLGRGMALALLAMYGLMAVAFRSYAQPLIVLAAIPFGVIGAILGHLLLGYSLSFMSLFGMVALSGVVVNDSLVLIAAINGNRREGMPVAEAVVAGSVRRVRPVLLTSLTTFFGLAPIILERSMQARFLVPAAISLAFGVLFVTVIALLLVPCGYLVLDDLRRRGRRTEESAEEATDVEHGELQPV